MKITTTTIDITPEDLKLMLDIIAPLTNSLPPMTTAPAKLIETARKLDKAIEEAQPKAEMPLPPEAPADRSKAGENQTVEESSTVEKKQVKAPICTDTWKVEELNLLRTCHTDKDAAFIYASHFKDARSENAVRQRWYKLDRTGEILHAGDHVQIVGGFICQGKIGDITKFTDDRQYANVVFFGNPATYQFRINDLKKVNRE